METTEMKSGIKFKRSALGDFRLLTRADIGKKLALAVLSNVTEKNAVISESGRKSYIVNLKAVAPDKVAQLKETFAEAEEVDIESTNGIFLTANIWQNGEETPRLPMRGEKVNCIIGEVANRDGEAVLRVTNIQVEAAHEGQTLDLQALFASQPAEQVA